MTRGEHEGDIVKVEAVWEKCSEQSWALHHSMRENKVDFYSSRSVDMHARIVVMLLECELQLKLNLRQVDSFFYEKLPLEFYKT